MEKKRECTRVVTQKSPVQLHKGDYFCCLNSNGVEKVRDGAFAMEVEAVDFGRGGAHIDEEGKERRVRVCEFGGVNYVGGGENQRG